MGPLDPVRRIARQVRRRARMARRDRLAPPPTPDGWIVGPPTFVGIGVQKAGTSWWFSLLTEHPEVYYDPQLPKELRFFDRYWSDPFGPEDAAAYSRFFPRPPGGHAGEWTPRYLSDHWVASLLHRAAPATRLLVLLRDPVERYRSGLTHDLQHGAIRHPSTAQDAFQRGLYHQQLRRWLRHFDRSRFLVLQYERCVRDPVGELRRTQRDLGLEPYDLPPRELDRRVNDTRVEKIELPERSRRDLAELYAGDVASLLEEFPEIDVSLWPNMSGLVG